MSQMELPRPADAPPAPATSPAGSPSASGANKAKQKESIRDTVESILFAFVLAFLFRTFEAEAFVIPTGSMAPTLYGRHKDTACAQCGSRVVVGASQEVNPRTGMLTRGSRLHSAVCSNCGYENPQLFTDLAFNGDRILVDKYPYEFGEPDRWDVFVFKFPEEPETNYIKRLVGLPGEVIRIRNGNLYRVEEGGAEKILRKRPQKQRVLQIPVYDHDHPPTKLIEAGWPERWAAAPNATWKEDAVTRSFSIDAKGDQSPQWLRYTHVLPMPSDWQALERGAPLRPQPRLVGDFCGYNTALTDRHPGARADDQVDFGPYWVPDLTVNFDLQIESIAADNPELLVELREGTSWYRARINAQTGEAVLEEVNTQLENRTKELGKGQSSLKGPGSYSISFANVDDRLCLWVNDKLVDFGPGAELDIQLVDNPYPTRDDLQPVGIAVQGLAANVSKLKLERDIYYRAAFPEDDRRNNELSRLQAELSQYVTDPEKWGDLYHRYADTLEQRTIDVPADHFLALGDNSPQSKDSRLWHEEIDTVPRKYLVGKAFWIYWPHGIPFLNGGRGFPISYNYELDGNGPPKKLLDYPRYTIPFYPQFERMKRIR